MKVQLVVVQGKPEGKVIPLALPVFRIGRGETCHLRPNSDQVSREHVELAVTTDTVTVRDLGSRNGTIVNGKVIAGVYTLKDGDLIQVGPLTFALSIQGAPVAAPAPSAAPKVVSLDDISHSEIESWLIADNANVPPESPSGVYGGETITIESYKGGGPKAEPRPRPTAKPPQPKPAPAKAQAQAEPAKPAAAAKAEPAKPAVAAVAKAVQPEPPRPEELDYERLPEGAGDAEPDLDPDDEEESAEVTAEEYIDESNPFYIAKKQAAAPPPSKAATQQGDSSTAANDILRRMMERRRASKS